jgi:hypothetical protein
MNPEHKVRFSEALEVRLLEDAARRNVRSIEDLVPIIVAEYYRMWDDLEGGAAILKMDD